MNERKRFRRHAGVCWLTMLIGLNACGTAPEPDPNAPTEPTIDDPLSEPTEPSGETVEETTESPSPQTADEPRPPMPSARVRRLRLVQRGRSLASAGDHAGALVAFRQGLELEGDDPVLLCEAGWAAFHVEDRIASEFLSRGSRLQMNPRRRAACLYNRGRLAERDAEGAQGSERQRLRAEAVAHYQESLELRPRNAETHRRYRGLMGRDFESEGPCPPAGPFATVQAFCDAASSQYESVVSCEALGPDQAPTTTGQGPAMILVRLNRDYMDQRDDFLLLPKDDGFIAAALGRSWYRSCSMGRYLMRSIRWEPDEGHDPMLVIDAQFTRSYSCAPSPWESCAERADELSECEGLSDESPVEDTQTAARVVCAETDGEYRCTPGIQFEARPNSIPQEGALPHRHTLLPWLRCPSATDSSAR